MAVKNEAARTVEPTAEQDIQKLIDNAKKAQEAFNSHPDNVKLEREIVNVEELL